MNNRTIELIHGASYSPRTPLWLRLAVTAVLIAGFGWLRLYAFPDRIVPLTSVLVLAVCLWHRDVRMLWMMTFAFTLMVIYKVGYIIPAGTVPVQSSHWLHAGMQLTNTLGGAAIIHVVIRLMGRLEHAVVALEKSNNDLEASNEELAAREEEITQQNEELQVQAEELEQQTEELNAQTEELQTLNEQIVTREQTLADLLETTAGQPTEQEALSKLAETVSRLFGDHASGAAVLEADGDNMVIHPLFGVAGEVTHINRDRSLSGLVLKRNRAACLGDTSKRPDLPTPPLEQGVTRSLASAPFRAASSMVGTLEVYSTAAGEWSDYQLRIVQWLADQCGLLWTAARFEQERMQLLESERSARTEAERATRAKDEFVATLSHELRTPLNAVLGWATLLKRSGCENPEEVLKGMEIIERNARHQGQLISDLLDVSRIMAGKIRLDVQSMDLSLVVESALETVRPTADAKQVQLHRMIEPMDRDVSGDPNRIGQVIWNLLSNAIKFTPMGGSVQVTVQRIASYVQIIVADTGEGIDPELLPHLFDRYRQADASATRKHGGLGLGLAIAKNLVELHGGSIHAHSDGLGKGATFKVLLPVRAVKTRPSDDSQHPRTSRGTQLTGDAPRLDGINVLVVDDEADARELVGAILREHGATVTTADSGEEALSRVESESPDLMISDIGMPGLDGYTLVRRLRAQKNRPSRYLPAVALTAFARTEDRTRALLAGFQAHVAKPVEAAELVATVASLRYAIRRDSHVDVRDS